ncbi:hypothetical protein [Vibrio harveyi]
MIKKTEDGVELATFGALGGFFDTVLEQYKTYWDFSNPSYDLNKLQQEEIIRLGQRQKDTIDISNIFTGMFLEAFIFDYAARKESINYAETYLDKLDPVSKWVVITRLFNEKGLNVSGTAVQSIKKAFKIRNNLAHNKSKKFPGMDPDNIEKFFNQAPPERLTPTECVKTLHVVLKELTTLDCEEIYGLQLLAKIEATLKMYPYPK